MTAFAYGGVLATAAFFLVVLVFEDLRRAILASLVFTTLALGALPLPLRSVSGASFALQVGAMLLAFTWLLMRRDSGLAIAYGLNPYTLLLFVFTLVLVAYLFLSQNRAYGVSTTIGFFVKGVLPLLALACLAPFDRTDVRLIVITIIVGSVLMALSLLAWGQTLGTERLSFGISASPITIARVIGLGAALLLLLAFFEPRFQIVKFSARVLLAIFLLFTIGLTGSRGPLVAVLFAVVAGFVLLGFRQRRRASAVFALGLIAAFLIASLIIPALNLDRYPGIQRIANRFDTFGSNLSDRTRLAFFQTAWEGFVGSSGVGLGTGDFAEIYGFEGSAYPHNIVLEVAVSQGVLGLAVLFAILFATLLHTVHLSRHHRLDPYGKALVGLWFFALFNAFVSMDIAGNYFLWVCGGILWLFDSCAEVATSGQPLSQATSG